MVQNNSRVNETSSFIQVINSPYFTEMKNFNILMSFNFHFRFDLNIYGINGVACKKQYKIKKIRLILLNVILILKHGFSI